MLAKEFYDRNAKLRYEDLNADYSQVDMHQPGERYHCIHDQLSDPGSLKAVELGFGSINSAAYLSSLFASYEAIDLSASELLSGREVGFSYRDSDLNKDWPLKNGAYDVLVAMMIFEHLFDPFHSFSETARVLTNGGLAFINLPNIGSIKCRWDLLHGRMPTTSSPDWFEKREWDGGHLHYFTVAGVRQVAEINGLSIKKIYPVGRFNRMKFLRPSLLSHEISYVLEKI